MKKVKTIAVVAAAVVLVTSSVVFADQVKTSPVGAYAKHFMRGMADGDPVQKLEKQKENIQQRVKDGKLTQEEADKVIAQIETKLKEMKEFNSLTLEQKKEKLISDFTASINESVKSGKMTQENADKAIADYKTKAEKWDGTGNPPFIFKALIGKDGFGQDFKGRGGPGHDFKDKGSFDKEFIGAADPAQMLEKQKENIQQRVKDGKMTQEEADKVIANFEQKVKSMQEFNSLTLEQKKEKLINDFTASTNERVKDGKFTQENADKAIVEYKAEVEKWDGTGRMPFMGKGFKGKGDHGKGFGPQLRMEKGEKAAEVQ